MVGEGRLPLAGIRVADFSWYGAGPIGTQKLAWYGAEVIRIESETRPDGLRSPGVARPGATGLNASGYYNNFNSNKLSLTLNMARPEAHELALRLIAKCDVVVENYQPSVFEKWGLTYEAMKAAREDVIFVRMPMVGTVGPHRSFQGFGASVTTLAGISHLSGYADRPPIGVGSNYPDYVVNCGHGSIAVLAALLHRKRTGEGQLVEVAQVLSTAAVVGPALLDYTVNGRISARVANRQPDAAPHGAFPCLPRPRTPALPGLNPSPQFPPDLIAAHEERWCVITAFTEEHWAALKRVMGDPGWAEQACFAGLLQRKANEDELERQVSAWTAGQQAEDLVGRLQAAGVPAGVVQTSEDVLDHDEHLRERGYYVYLDHPETGLSAYDGSPFKMSRTRGGPLRPAPLLGEHTYYVASEIIGLSEGEIADLTASQVLH